MEEHLSAEERVHHRKKRRKERVRKEEEKLEEREEDASRGKEEVDREPQRKKKKRRKEREREKKEKLEKREKELKSSKKAVAAVALDLASVKKKSAVHERKMEGMINIRSAAERNLSAKEVEKTAAATSQRIQASTATAR